MASRRDLEKVLCKKNFFERAFTRTELDVVLSHLDADGSGCVDVGEFITWLSHGRSDFVVEEEEVTGDEEDTQSLFQAAAQQLRAALLERSRQEFDECVPDGIHPGPVGAERVITPGILAACGLTEAKL